MGQIAEKETKNTVTKISINTGKRKFQTEPMLYGLFFEDINRAGDGGVYPELLRNRSFDDSFFPDDLKPQEKDFANENGWVLKSRMEKDGRTGLRNRVLCQGKFRHGTQRMQKCHL
ncbi:MAG: hypothetical protein J6A77_11240 [Lachnospiraceae bacterium]|nr:hypothetical protein [Lachnospiraceae bacterium]